MKLNVVVVDDQQFQVMLIENLIASIETDIQFEIFSFLSPLEAFGFIQNNKVDIVIADYVMPELNGIELLEKIRKIDSFIHTIIVTAENDEKTMSLALQRGATDFLTKPIKPYEFQPKLRNLLKLSRAERLIQDRAYILEEEVKKATMEIRTREKEVILRLSKAAEYKDTDTGYHIERVAMYSELIAREYGLSASKCEEIMLAAPLHDVGKIAIPDNILKKPGKLDANEWAIMQKHTVLGYKIFDGTNVPLLKTGAFIALYHHEKWNGKGYPFELKGENIPLEARIVAIADVFDALTMKRPYKEPWPFDKAFGLIEREQGEHFDPELATIFLENEDRVKEIYREFQDGDINGQEAKGEKGFGTCP
jgi:response regulator RpfG family c-di-GMP phosphodiesterase